MFRRRAPRHGFTATVPTPRPAAHPSAAGHPAAAGHPCRWSLPRPLPPAAGPAAGRDPGGPPPAGLDVSTAHPARVWNYWLGGRDYFAADRAAGEQIGQDFPHLAQTARAERAFLVRAVRIPQPAGRRGSGSSSTCCAGLPTGGNTHEIAQRIAPDTGIVYADNDPAVLVHARALLQTPMLASTPEGTVSYVDADLRDVAAVLAGSARSLDLEQPVALIMLGVLGYLDDHGAARSITSQLMDALPSGSYLAIADGVAGTGPVSRGAAAVQRRRPWCLTTCAGRRAWPASSTGWT